MKKIKIIIALLIAGMFLLSCKKNSGSPEEIKPAVTPVGTIAGTPVTQTIGNSGGTVVSDDGEMELIIPSGALTSNTAITIQPITNNAPNGRRKAYRCLPDGLQFAKNITIKFHYTGEDLTATKPDYMMVAFQTAQGNWQVVDNVSNDTTAKTTSVSVNHFTDFTAFDVMRIEPASLYLKTGQTGNYKVTATGMSVLNGVLLLTELLERPETWKANGVTGGNSTHGTIAPSADRTLGVYTAPATAPAINPVIINAEINFPFTIYVHQFNKGILTANAYIIGGRYKVDVETSNEMAIGTGEIFRMRDHARFTVNLIGTEGTVTDMQNSIATFQKIANSPSGCNTTIEVSGTGPINIRDHDVLGVVVAGQDVYVHFSADIQVVNPKFLISCPGVTPKLNEIPISSFAGAVMTCKDNGQIQVYETGAAGQSMKYTVTPLQ
jgi:hypothetical protein